MHSVVVISDIAIYRNGIASSLTGRAEIRVVGWATLDRFPVPDLHCDAYIVDCVGLGPGQARQHLDALGPDGPPVIAITVPSGPTNALDYLEAGAAGCVSNEATLDELYETVLAVLRDGACVQSQVVPKMLDRLQAKAETPPTGSESAAPRLTVREQQVAELIGRHLSNKEIANELGISINTVKQHVHNLLGKLGVDRRAHASALVRAHR